MPNAARGGARFFFEALAEATHSNMLLLSIDGDPGFWFDWLDGDSGITVKHQSGKRMKVRYENIERITVSVTLK